MERFHALFHGTDVYINGDHCYSNNEILVAYLNLDEASLREWYYDLQDSLKGLLLRPDMSVDEIHQDYNQRVYYTQGVMDKLDALWMKLPPFGKLLDIRKQYDTALLRCLDRHIIYFHSQAERANAMAVYGYGDAAFYDTIDCDDDDCDDDEAFDDQRYVNRRKLYIPECMEWYWNANGDGEQMQQLLEDIQEVNDDIERTLMFYIHWLEDVLRVKNCYEKLLEEYLHIKHGYLTETELAKQFVAYFKAESRATTRFRRLSGSVPLASGHEVFTPRDGTPILCTSFDFDRLGAFLYEDFFRGLANHFIPKRCSNCGRWFLIQAGIYSDYCENPLEEDGTKTCRQVSVRKKYDTKCKNDPIWLTYNRAYKAHYARYLKKKMTTAQFEQWSRYAVELRDKAEAGEMTFDDYQKEIKI